MIATVLDRLGQDRAFEMFEFLILLFVFLSVVTLIFLLIYHLRSRKSARTSEQRIESLVRHLGRDLFGDDAWHAVEDSLAGRGKRVDTLLSVLDRESFEVWAEEAQSHGDVDEAEISLLRQRLSQPGESRRIPDTPAPVSEFRPTFGMPVAVHQGSFQSRGTIAEVDDHTFTMWVLSDVVNMDDSIEASFVLLSRSGTYQFDARFTQHADGTLVVQRPASIVRSQRRRFERYPAKLPASVVRFLGDDGPLQASITELSGGGATMTNPAGRFAEGNVLELSFEAGGRTYTVAGRVVRAESDREVLHLRFEALKEQDRQEIAHSIVVARTTISPSADPTAASN